MLSISNSLNSTPALKSKKTLEKKKGLALRDITNQTPHLKTLKKTSKKAVVSKLKKTKTETHVLKESDLKSNRVAQKSDVKESIDTEYMPPRVENPIEYTNDDYKIDLSWVKPTSKGCNYSKFKIIQHDFQEEDIVFRVDDDLKFQDANDEFLYF